MRKPLSVHVLTRRALHWYGRATAAERQAGRDWYRVARRSLQELAWAHRKPLDIVAGVCAVLSPMVRWEANLVDTDRVLAMAQLHPEQRTRVKTGAFPRNVEKAFAIVDGGSALPHLSGPKVVSFYYALIGKASAPVVDSIIINALVNGDPTPFSTSEDAKATFDRPRDLEAIRQAIIAAAAQLDQPIHAVQATIWLVYRGMRDAL